MNNRSRTENTIYNAVTNVIVQVVTVIISFLTRIIFIKAFGENYLGINGLFSNILSVLSLAELGVGHTIIFSMYKPIAERDYKKLSALIGYYKKLYFIIGIIVAAFGLILIPFLGSLVKLEADIGNVTFYYLLYLLNTVSSYFLVYKTSILIADQKTYITKICTVSVKVVQFVVLSVIAFLVENFSLYLAVQIFFSIADNVICSCIAQKKYPFIKDKVELPKAEKKSIWNNILAMFSYQIGGVVLNNTDNILISVLVSMIAVGFYSNYSMIIATINVFLQLVFTSAQASIGNLAAEAAEDKQFKVFNTLQFLSFWLTCFSSVCFAVLFQDCITILYTDHFLLPYSVVIACVFSFYMLNILQPVYCFRNTVGLFRQTRWVMLFTSLINLVVSIVLGKLWGLCGIIIGTGIARLTTNFWYEPIQLFKVYFKKDVKQYFKRQILYAVLTVVLIVAMCAFSQMLQGLNIFLRFGIKIVICCVIPNLTLLLLFKNTEETKTLYSILCKKVKLPSFR